MNTAKRALTTLALAGAALSMAGTAHASQVIEASGNLRINRDESVNFHAETLGDSVNQGIGNVISPTSVVGGLASSLI